MLTHYASREPSACAAESTVEIACVCHEDHGGGVTPGGAKAHRGTRSGTCPRHGKPRHPRARRLAQRDEGALSPRRGRAERPLPWPRARSRSSGASSQQARLARRRRLARREHGAPRFGLRGAWSSGSRAAGGAPPSQGQKPSAPAARPRKSAVAPASSSGSKPARTHASRSGSGQPSTIPKRFHGATSARACASPGAARVSLLIHVPDDDHRGAIGAPPLGHRADEVEDRPRHERSRRSRPSVEVALRDAQALEPPRVVREAVEVEEGAAVAVVQPRPHGLRMGLVRRGSRTPQSSPPRAARGRPARPRPRNRLPPRRRARSSRRLLGEAPTPAPDPGSRAAPRRALRLHGAGLGVLGEAPRDDGAVVVGGAKAWTFLVGATSRRGCTASASWRRSGVRGAGRGGA